MSPNQIDNVKAVQVLLHELMVKKQLEGKVVLFVDLSPRLPPDISDRELGDVH